MHRLVARNPDGTLTTRGDANGADDSTPVPAAAVRGLPRLDVPYVGLPVLWLHQGRYGPLAALALVLVAAVALGGGGRDGSERRVTPRGWTRIGPGARRAWAATPTRLRRVGVGTVAVCLAAGPTLSWHPGHAVFVANTRTASNAWTTGTVTFGANSPAGALFSVGNALPGSTDTRCVKVIYTGGLPARVHLYVTGTGLTGTLGSYVTLQVKEGTGDQSDCGDFVRIATSYNTTGLTDTTKNVASFAASARNFATGVSSWNATQNTSRTYQFAWRLQDDNAAVGRTLGVTFTWEAQS
jgi:hypothetical protein